MEALTIYRVKGKDIGLEFLFKYDLKGNLKAFEIAEGELNDEQQLWLFNVIRFPSNESKINYWKENKKYSDKFDPINPAPPVIKIVCCFDVLICYQLFFIEFTQNHLPNT